MTNLPCGVGFGIQSKEAVKELKGHADIAIIGSHITRLIEAYGIDEAEAFLKEIKEVLS